MTHVVDDISYNCAPIDHSAYDPEAVIIRAGQGIWEDPKHKENVTGARQKGTPFGEYFVYDPRFSVSRQFESFVSWRSPDSIVDAYDFEKLGLLTKGQLQDAAVQGLVAGVHATVRRWLFYSNLNILINYLGPVATEIAKYADIWLAWPVGSTQEVPTRTTPVIRGYPKPVLWQYFWQAHRDGVKGAVDVSRFELSEEQWQGFVRPGSTSPISLEEKVARLWAAHPELH